jgi:pimeloyl-ACP methyl ester carboxylesterase
MHLVGRALIAGACALVLLLPSGTARAMPTCHPETDPQPFTKTDLKIAMSDGVPIAATLYAPLPSGCPHQITPHAAIIMFHGLGQTRNSLDLNTWSANRVAETYLAPKGYDVLTFDARAHGESGGLFSLDGPRELQDTRELFAWLTKRPEVDPAHVGAFGVSYGGGMVWLAAASGVPFAAIATAATWTDLEQALIPQALIRAGVVVGFSQSVPITRYAPELATMLHVATSEELTPELRTFLAERSARARLARLTVPTLMLQGRRDFAFDADQALVAFRLLKGPKRLYLGDLGHAPAPNPAAEVNHFALETRAWFDRFLGGAENGLGGRPQVELARDPWDGKTVTYNGLPPTRVLRFATRGRSRLTATGKVVHTVGRVPHLETFGTAIVRATVSSRTGYRHLVAVLTAVKPGGGEIVITDGGIELQRLSMTPRTVTIRLPDEITPIPAGSRLRLTLAATSTVQSIGNLVYLLPVRTGSIATIGRVTLTLPVLKRPISP